ncbi:MAG: ethanolamine utilization protein, partial [Tissierella sp.]|nr:ethanolamine utilization protein [Tissierella sp.]
MNKYIFDENIEEMAKKYTDLTKSDIDLIKSKAETIVNNTEEFIGFDVFIDILNVITNEAVVVFHRPPLISKSIYKESVIGKTAYRKNEPGPLRTLETGLKSVGLYAFSQEGLLIKQTSYPVLNDSRTIAVVIVEEDISDDIKASFDVSNRDKSYQVVSDFIAEVEIKDQSITDYID